MSTADQKAASGRYHALAGFLTRWTAPGHTLVQTLVIACCVLDHGVQAELPATSGDGAVLTGVHNGPL